jgi:hypothetical protein
VDRGVVAVMAALVTTKPRILFAGCSHVSDSGFTDTNQKLYHWPQLLAKEYDCNFKNIAIGGISNDEIFVRTVEAVLEEKYDLVIVMWSDMLRNCVYFSDNNIDDFTVINKGRAFGFNCPNKDAELYSKLQFTFFQNRYIILKKWLLLTMTLDAFLTTHNQKFIFIRGFDNYVSDFVQVEYQKNLGFIDASDDLKQILDFDQRPDHYINSKISKIKQIINNINQSNWIDFESFSFVSSMIDVADDGDHAGVKTNRRMFDMIVDHIDSKKIFDFVEQDSVKYTDD